MNLHTRLSRRTRLALAVAAVAAVTVGPATIGPAAVATAGPAPPFGAADLADAVLFDRGPAAPLLAGVDRTHTDWTDLGRRYRTNVTEAVRADDRWGRSFAARLQSGDRAAIDGALHDLGALARAEADRLYGRDTVERAIGTGDAGAAVYLLTPPFQEKSLDLVVENTSAIILVYTLASSFTTDPGEPASLLREQLVHEIATRLATRG
jgi:hypothetical protein